MFSTVSIKLLSHCFSFQNIAHSYILAPIIVYKFEKEFNHLGDFYINIKGIITLIIMKRVSVQIMIFSVLCYKYCNPIAYQRSISYFKETQRVHFFKETALEKEQLCKQFLQQIQTTEHQNKTGVFVTREKHIHEQNSIKLSEASQKSGIPKSIFSCV